MADWGAIEVRGARENNLRDVSLDIPKRRLTVFTGVSGSGKSSLVFGTIAAESQRLINETYSAFVQGFMPTLARPDVDSLEGLTTAIILDQERMGANVRSTVGTVTDANAMLRVVFSRLGQAAHRRAPGVLVQRPLGHGRRRDQDRARRRQDREPQLQRRRRHVPALRGHGHRQRHRPDPALRRDASRSPRARSRVPGYTADGWSTRMFSESGFFDPDKPIRDYTETELHDFLYKEPVKVRINGINLTYEGLVPRIQKSMLSKDVDALQPHIRAFVERAVTFSTCPDCGGTRLNEAARSSKIDGVSIADACAMQISDLAEWVRGLDEPSVAPLLAALGESLDSFVEMGLGYLSLDRPSGHALGRRGAADADDPPPRVVADRRHLRLRRADDRPARPRRRADELAAPAPARQGQHRPRRRARPGGDPDRRPRRRHGPGRRSARRDGRATRARSTGLIASGTATGRHLDVRQELKPSRGSPRGSIPIRNARLHNLKDVSVDVPLGVLVAVTGVAGSGKSSLIHGCLPRTDPSVTVIDQSAIRGSRRSNPATYTGILDPIRTAFAKANGVKPALFSANSEGACPNCNGLGKTYTSLGFMAEVVSVCEVCEGRRFTDDVLEYRLRGRNIVEVLAMSVEEARDFFTEKPVRVMLDRLADVGLGYVSLGQELDTLSGGERQRLKLAIEMSGDTEVYVLDEPTTGLHMQDVDNLVGLLDRLVDVRADGDRHRAQPRRRRPRRLGDRPRSRRRPRRRAGDLRGAAGRARPGRGSLTAQHLRRRLEPVGAS